MEIDQLLYGYRDGHRLLASSIELSESANWDLVRATDRPTVSEKELQTGITFGFTFDVNSYALCRTWAAKEIDRPGAVWTHVLLLPEQLESPIECFPLLHKPMQPDISRFQDQITYLQQPGDSDPPLLSWEEAHLLLLFAAKPTGGLKAWSSAPSLDLLTRAQKHWQGILHKQAFATSAGKKNIVEQKRSVIISAVDQSMNSLMDGIELSDTSIKIPSTRITHSWDFLGQDLVVFGEWLKQAGKGIKQSMTNLKLVMEALLLGTGELEDNKLLKRISAVVQGDKAPILRYLIGQNIGVINAPQPWLSALFLLGEENWGKWGSLVDTKNIGALAAKAPVALLADRLENLANGVETDNALEELAKSISHDDFELLRDYSSDAATVLSRRNPKLLPSFMNSRYWWYWPYD